MDSMLAGPPSPGTRCQKGSCLLSIPDPDHHVSRFQLADFLFGTHEASFTKTKGEDLHSMKSPRLLFLTLLSLAALSAGVWAQTSDSTASPPKTSPSKDSSPKTSLVKKTKPVAAAPARAVATITAEDVQELKAALAAQQQQILLLNQQLQQAQHNWQQAQTVATEASSKATAAETEASLGAQKMDELQSDLADLKTVSYTGLNAPVLHNAMYNLQDPASANSPEQIYNKQMESPITLRFRGINITPGGYAAAEFVRRSRALGADVSTPFNSLTMPGASQSQLSEFFGSGRQSKATVFVDGRLKNVDLSSYISGDFLSAGVTSSATSTNSYTFRLRQAWAQAKFDNGWSFLGGQSWSLVTENGYGIAPDDDMGKTNDARPKTIDPSYNVGFTFARQWGLRLTKSYDKVAFAVAVENPQATVTTHGNASNFLLGEAGASNSYNTTATYSFNPSPDLIAKVAFDPGFGHYEIFGLYDRFTGRVFPCVENFASTDCGSLTGPSAVLAYNKSKNGGGVGASARWNLFSKHIVFGVKGFGGSGIGRYAPGGLADTTINADGTIRLLKNLQGLGTLEYNTKKFGLYGYGGVEYAARGWDIDATNPATPVPVGYGAPGFNNTGCYTEAVPGSGGFAPGSPGKCTGDTRALIEGTLGFWYRFYSGPKGRFQYGTQVSYVTRNTWSGDGRQPNGIDTMVFSSFRYYLP